RAAQSHRIYCRRSAAGGEAAVTAAVGSRAPVVFALAEAPPDEATANLLGLWLASSLPSPGAVAFDAAAPTVEETPLWSADLPGDPAAAAARLAVAQAQLSGAEGALGAAEERL